ncbi:hypothetical protein GGS26DRAFT_556617 [Hypomontagnella submonticulosa]|nr:hypothetical protein GGS26DRAFT_556617 [Hypomontagnella submonticulosa]
MTSIRHFHPWDTPAGSQLKKLVYLLAAASSLTSSFASLQEVAVTSVVTHHQPIETSTTANIASLDARDGWSFSCFSSGEPCKVARVGVDGATKQTGSSVSGCSPISAKGCSEYSFISGGDFKLCLYASDDCTGDGNGLVGSRSCLKVDSSETGSWKVVPAINSGNHVCD